MAVRILVNLVYVAILIGSTIQGHWLFGLAVIPFLAFGAWRLGVLLNRYRTGTSTRADR